jgi:AAA15 family ATPase/GTPase
MLSNRKENNNFFLTKIIRISNNNIFISYSLQGDGTKTLGHVVKISITGHRKS